NELMGETFIAQREYKAAIPVLREAIGFSPNKAHARYDLGLAQHYLKKYQEALESFREAVRLDPKHPNYQLSYGCCLVKLGRKEDAQQVHRTLATLDKAKAKELLDFINSEGSN